MEFLYQIKWTLFFGLDGGVLRLCVCVFVVVIVTFFYSFSLCIFMMTMCAVSSLYPFALRICAINYVIRLYETRKIFRTLFLRYN